MDRIVGYIDLNNVLKVDARFTDIGTFMAYLRKNCRNIKVQNNSITATKFMLIFDIQDTKYYFKYDESENPFTELIAEEIAKCMNIPCIDYDIATIGGFIGTLSKDFVSKDEVQVISGEDIIERLRNNKLLHRVFGVTNNLESIWMGLISLLKNNPNRDEIIKHLMKQIIDMYVFDIITRQDDRHSSNWEIVKYKDGHYDLRPLFDNARILYSDEQTPNLLLKVTHNKQSIEENIREFDRISSNEFSRLIEDNLWVIDEENIRKVLKRVEDKIEYQMPRWIKEKYIEKFREHLEYLRTCLNDIKTKGVK